jgi:KDO2-lipid IV(A) lauroyltransferase
LLQGQRPKIFITGHLGSWELAIAAAAIMSKSKGGVVLRRVDNPFLHWILLRLKMRTQEEWIEKKGAIDHCLQKLQRGESVVLLMDENAGHKGLFIDFFGRLASTRKTAALLALTTDTPIVAGAAIRNPDRNTFLYRLELIEPADYGFGPKAIHNLTQEINGIFERWIRESPKQWRWVHWRWKNRPGGSVETYTGHDLKKSFNQESESNR